MSKLVIGIIIAVVAVGGFVFWSNREASPEGAMQSPDATAESSQAPGVETEVQPAGLLQFSGTVLAGASSPLLDFAKADFDKALASDKLIVLYFYANWCPICKEEVPKLYSVFNSLTGDDVIGFRVNYNDNETDTDEKALAKEYGVAYQHTKVFVRNGQRIGKWPDSWDEARYLSEIEKALK